MFAAVSLFVILLLTILVIAFLRFQERPRSSDAPAPAAMHREAPPPTAHALVILRPAQPSI